VKAIVKLILLLAVVSVLLMLVSMGVANNNNVQPAATTTIAPHNAMKWNRQAIDSGVRQLSTGNVVLRMGTGAYSHLLAQMNRSNKSYSHCGIVMVEHGYPFVYHSIGGEDNPDARLRRDSASRFFSALHNTAIAIVQYSFTPKEQETLIEVVKGYYHKKPRFDTRFDLSTDDDLYCTEFVYKAITAATADTGFIPTTSAIRHTYIGTDNLYINDHANLVWQVKFK
jgi:hypothetical protein